MGSLVVKLDRPTMDKIQNRGFYSDVDVLTPVVTDVGVVPMVHDIEAVKAAIRNILMWRVGESVLSPEFGHNIHRSMYEQMTEVSKDRLVQEIHRAIDENEPRVKVKSVDVYSASEDEDNNALKVNVTFEVVGSKTKGAEFNMESTIVGK